MNGFYKIFLIFLYEYINNFKNFEGRANRTQYWYSMLAIFLIQIAFSILGLILGALSAIPVLGLIFTLVIYILGIVQFAYSIFLIVPGIAINVRRLHDLNRSGLWYLWYALAMVLIGFVFIIVMVYAIASYYSNYVQANSVVLILICLFFGLVLAAITVAYLVFMCFKGTVGANKFGDEAVVQYYDYQKALDKIKSLFKKKQEN